MKALREAVLAARPTICQLGTRYTGWLTLCTCFRCRVNSVHTLCCSRDQHRCGLNLDGLAVCGAADIPDPPLHLPSA